MPDQLTTRPPTDHNLSHPNHYRPDTHPAIVYVAALAPGSRRSTKSALDLAANLLSSGRYDALTLPWHELRYQHLTALRAALAERYAPATTNKTLAAVRSCLKHAWRLGLLDAEQYQRATDVPPIPAHRAPAGRALEPHELAALLDTCRSDPSPAGARDLAILSTLIGAGIRRAELVALDRADFVRNRRALTITAGKGNRDRTVYLDEPAAAALTTWLAHTPTTARGPDPLFTRIRRAHGGHPTTTNERLTAQAVGWIAQRRADEAGLAHLSPHDFRRTMITRWLDAGVDLLTVQRQAGHAQPQTTARYDRRGDNAQADAAQRLALPPPKPDPDTSR